MPNVPSSIPLPRVETEKDYMKEVRVPKYIDFFLALLTLLYTSIGFCDARNGTFIYMSCVWLPHSNERSKVWTERTIQDEMLETFVSSHTLLVDATPGRERFKFHKTK